MFTFPVRVSKKGINKPILKASIKDKNTNGKISKKNLFLSSLIIEKNLTESEPFCPIILGVSFLDQIKTMESLKKIEFTNIAYPILFLPFLSRASEIIGKKIHIKFDQNEILLNLNVNIYSNILNQELKVIANNVEVQFLENLDNFTDSEWQNLYKLSENTFVEESESLKQGGAGAGLTDND